MENKSDFFLSEDEISKLTESTQPACQKRKLEGMKIPFVDNGKTLIVLRYWAERAPFEAAQKENLEMPGANISLGNFGG